MKGKLFEMLIPKRPLSLQAKSHNLQAWKDYVYGRARNAWKGGGLLFRMLIAIEDLLQMTLI
jgi:hypothetical protein